jgi:hypothetical protein
MRCQWVGIRLFFITKRDGFGQCGIEQSNLEVNVGGQWKA